MSGRYFDYSQFHFEETAEKLDSYLLKHGDELPEAVRNRFALAAKTVRCAGDMIKEVDYLICGNTGDDTFLERWKDNFERFSPKKTIQVFSEDNKVAAIELLDGVYDLVEIWQPKPEEVYNKKWRESWLKRARECGAHPSW